ncbi:MAG: MFS transporter [Pseudodonghicola sp.]
MALIVTLAIQALVSMASLTIPVIAPEAALATGHPASLAGVFIGIVYAGAMASSLISGDLIERFGPIRLSQICLLLSTAGLMLAAQGGLWQIGAGAILLGFGYGPVTPASSYILIRSTPPTRMALTFSLKQTGVPIGGAAAGVLVPMAAALSDWSTAVLMVAAMCAIMAVLSEPLRSSLDAGRTKTHHQSGLAALWSPFALIFSHKALRDIALCSYFFGAVQLCVTTYLVLWLTQSYGLDLVTAGILLAFAQGGGVVGRLLWGWLADRFVPPRRMLSNLGFIIGACIVLFAIIGSDWPLIVVALVAIVAGATAIGWNGVYLAEVARLAPAGLAGKVTGGTLFFTYFGVVTGPPSFAAILTHTGSFPAAFMAIGSVILTVALFLGLTRPRLSDL